jgi:hypothetical protein
MLPYSTDAPMDCTWTSWMASTLGSARETPWQGQVKLVPSMRKAFSLTPDPNADTVLTVPLAGEVGDTPGADLIMSNMLNRRVGIVFRYSCPKRDSNPLLRASIRDVPSTMTASAMFASPRTTVRSSVADAPMMMLSSR